MSNFYKPVNIPNLAELQAQLDSFFSATEYGNVRENGSYYPFPMGVHVLQNALSEFIPAILSIGLTLDDVAGGVSLTAQSKKSVTPIYSIAHKYTLEIPLTTNTAFINFYLANQPATMTLSDSGILYPKYDEGTSVLLERHQITGAFMHDGSIPRTLESNPAFPVHILRFAIPSTSEKFVKQLFEFT